MTWKPIDFYGLLSLREPVYDQLNEYLSMKEEEVCKSLLKLFSPQDHPEIKPPVPSTFSFHLRLSDAIEAIDKYVRKLLLSKKKILQKSMDQVKKQVNQDLWDYVETLESTLVELFQTLEQMGLEVIRSTIMQTVDSIKVMLMHRMEQAIWAIKRLENILKDYQSVNEGEGSLKSYVTRFFQGAFIDPQLMVNLRKSQQYLTKQYHAYASSQSEYLKLWRESQQKTQKFEHFHAFRILDRENQDLYKKLDQYLKIFESDHFSKSPFKQEIIFLLRSLMSVDKARMLFREYYQILLSLLYSFSYRIKIIPREYWKEVDGNPLSEEALLCYKKESLFLENLLGKYRQFLLTTDANPYIRSRLGFSEWIVGPEPGETKSFIGLIFDLNTLTRWFDEMIVGLNVTGSGRVNLEYVQEQLQALLHTMGQPLISRTMLRQLSEKILGLLKEIQELSSTNMQAVWIVGETLSKALRIDWKYQVLYSLKEFQELYRIHQGIVGVNEDRQHLSRFQKFKTIIDHLEAWVRDKTAQKHLYEIEHDVNDIKEHLQDFFMFVKRMKKNPGNSEDFEQQIQNVKYQLLEYRYLFAGFFHHLRQNIAEERFFRVNFLFVDQYFESIEMQLRENLENTED